VTAAAAAIPPVCWWTSPSFDRSAASRLSLATLGANAFRPTRLLAHLLLRVAEASFFAVNKLEMRSRPQPGQAYAAVAGCNCFEFRASKPGITVARPSARFVCTALGDQRDEPL